MTLPISYISDCIEEINCLFEIYRFSGKDIYKTRHNFRKFINYCKEKYCGDTEKLEKVYEYIVSNNTICGLEIYDGFPIPEYGRELRKFHKNIN